MSKDKHIRYWSKDDYIKYHVQRLSDVVDKMAVGNFNEIGMKLDGDLDDDMHLKVVDDRNNNMDKCIKIINELRELVLEDKGIEE